MQTFELITTTQLATKLGISRQAIVARVQRGSLTPATQLASGAYLFNPEPVE